MSVDLGNGLAKTGLKTVTKLHTSTFIDGEIELEGFKLVKAIIKMPKDKMEALDVSVSFFTLTPGGSYTLLESTNPVEDIRRCTPTKLRSVKCSGSSHFYAEYLLSSEM